MKPLIYVIILTALPVSMSWGQDWFGFDTVNAVVQVHTDTTYNWQDSYYKQKHRADSLNKRLDECVANQRVNIVYKNSDAGFYWWNKHKALRDSADTLFTGKLIKVNTWPGYWRIDTTWSGISITTQAPPLFYIDTTWRPIVPVEEGGE